MAIDRAVLLPGQELMERMDRDFNNTGDGNYRAEQEKIRREQTGSQAESKEEGQDPEQNKETREKMRQDPSEKANTQTA